MSHLSPLPDALGPIRDVHAHLLTPAAAWQRGRPRRTEPDHFALIGVAAGTGFVALPRDLRDDERDIERGGHDGSGRG